MTLVRFLVQRSLTLLVSSVIAGVTCGVSSVLVLALLNQLVGGQVARDTSVVIGAYSALVVVVTVSKIFSFALLARLVQSAVHDLRIHLSEVVVQAPLRTIEEQGTAALFALLTDDITAVTNGLATLPILLINAAVVIGCGIYLLWLSWPMALGLLLAIAVWATSYATPARFARQKMSHARTEQDRLMECFRGLIEGNKELKLGRERRERFFEQEFRPTAGIVRNLNVRGMEIFAGAIGWGQSLSFVLIGVALFAFGTTLAVVVQPAVVVVLFLTGPLESLVLLSPTLMRSRISLERLQTLTAALTTEPTAAANDGCTPQNLRLATPWRQLRLVDLSYAYQSSSSDSVFRVGPLDFSLNCGETVFLVGGNGSGKSTFIKLLAGLYTPDAGGILWDDRPVTPALIESYRSLFAAVFSDYFLFRSLPIATEATIAKAEHYLERLHLQDKVAIRDGCFSTLALSQGQRQRLALVAAYLEDRPIYIFDEWAASQDPAFRRVFYRELLPEFKAHGKTVVVISHDEEYYDAADRLVKLHDGCIESDRRLR